MPWTVFFLPLNLERSLFKFASASTCISPQARCIMNSAFAIFKALEATVQLFWRSYAEKKEAGCSLRTIPFIWSHDNCVPLALIIGQPRREAQGSSLLKAWWKQKVGCVCDRLWGISGNEWESWHGHCICTLQWSWRAAASRCLSILGWERAVPDGRGVSSLWKCLC